MIRPMSPAKKPGPRIGDGPQAKLRDRHDVAGKKSFRAEALQKLKEHLEP